MEVATCSTGYADASFYETTQQSREGLEWYAAYEVIRPLLQRLMQYTDSILVLGPGTSGLHEQLYDSGYRGITCVDFSSKVLQSWRQRSTDAGRTSLKYQHADIVQGLAYEHYPYNVIIDKGTLDCISCRATGLEDAGKALQVIWNNLKNPGVFVMVSHGSPDMRLPLLQQAAWENVQVKVIIPPDTAELAAGQTVTTVREYSAQVECPDSASYVYICRKPY